MTSFEARISLFNDFIHSFIHSISFIVNTNVCCVCIWLWSGELLNVSKHHIIIICISYRGKLSRKLIRWAHSYKCSGRMCFVAQGLRWRCLYVSCTFEKCLHASELGVQVIVDGDWHELFLKIRFNQNNAVVRSEVRFNSYWDLLLELSGAIDVVKMWRHLIWSTLS